MDLPTVNVSRNIIFTKGTSDFFSSYFLISQLTYFPRASKTDSENVCCLLSEFFSARNVEIRQTLIKRWTAMHSRLSDFCGSFQMCVNVPNVVFLVESLNWRITKIRRKFLLFKQIRKNLALRLLRISIHLKNLKFFKSQNYFKSVDFTINISFFLLRLLSNIPKLFCRSWVWSFKKYRKIPKNSSVS